MKNNITWITGNSQSGKSTLAEALKIKFNDKGKSVFILDGDEIRDLYNPSLGFSKQDRWKHNINVAKMAIDKNNDYDMIIVAVICPYKALRKKIKKITKCKFIYLEGGLSGDKYPYDIPKLY